MTWCAGKGQCDDNILYIKVPVSCERKCDDMCDKEGKFVEDIVTITGRDMCDKEGVETLPFGTHAPV
ncbi:hypothetical protein EB118_11925, partial [bacterium]|nr:hypothetical protein [bacterium]